MNKILSAFYIKNWYYTDNIENLDMQFVSPLLRRKLSGMNNMAVFALNKCYDNSVEEVIFSSQHGELERLIQMVNQYTIENEVSPIMFSSSVHNYLAGLFVRLINKAIPYTAISACGNSLSTGLLTASLGKFNNVLYCYCDTVESKRCVCVNIAKNCIENKSKLILKKANEQVLTDDFEKFISLLKKETSKIILGSYVLEYEKNN